MGYDKIMINFLPTICQDNFFDEPDKIFNLAKQVSYTQTESISGFRSTDTLQVIDKDLNKYINNKIVKLAYPSLNFKSLNNVSFTAQTHFQKSNADLHDGWVHKDEETLTAIIYLTPEKTSGTSLFSLKKEYIKPDWQIGMEKYKYFKDRDKYSNKDKKRVLETKLKHNNHFTKNVSFEGKFNRMICFDSKQWHAAEVCDKERLVIISFIDNLKENNIK